MARRSNARRRAQSIAAILLATAIAAGCTGDDDAAGGAVTARPSPASTSRAAADEPDVTPSTPGVVDSTTGPIATIAEEGIPGIDSADPFCRAWSEFAGSFQTLAFVSAAGSDPLAALRLEVVAAAAVATAAMELDAEFPEPIAGEQDLFIGEVIGPFARRAERAIEELRTAGLTTAELDVLRVGWLGALAGTHPDDPDIVVTLPADIEAVVGDATASLSTTLPPIASDPSLITRAETPATFDHLADQCPDQGTLAGNDAID